MKGVKVKYPVYFDMSRFLLMDRTDPDTLGGSAITHLTVEINEDYIARSSTPAPESQYKHIYFGDREFDNFFLFLVEKPDTLILFDQWLRLGLIAYIDGYAKVVRNMNCDIADADMLLYDALKKAGFVL